MYYDVFRFSGLFPNSTEFVTEHYLVEIAPSTTAYAIMWPLTHAWHFAWLVYVTSVVIRSSSYGPLCVLPGHLSSSMFIFFILGCLSDSAWLVLRNRFLAVPSLVLLSTSVLSALTATMLAHRQLNRTGLQLLCMKLGSEIWWTRCLLFNGLALHVAWNAILVIINACIVASYF
jgi:hypothetical protein